MQSALTKPLGACLAPVLVAAGAVLFSSETCQAQVPFSLREFAAQGNQQKDAVKINDAIYQAVGFSNTFLVVTKDGNVVIDTSSLLSAKTHKQLLDGVNSGPVKYIILTHGHDDHCGGVKLWKGDDTKIITQRNFVEFRAYQDRLAGYFARTNAAQFNLDVSTMNTLARQSNKIIKPDILFDDRYEFELGGVKFELYSAPGETPDHLAVWVPQYKAAFIGDNYYASFPNMYTLRGTRPRWPLEYIASIEMVMSWKPEILLPSHGPAILGADKVAQTLQQYRDAIQYIHDETLKGMNEGKDVFTLMRSIKLPAELDVGEFYGKVSWSVRGIYEGYVGWFDLNPTNMYEVPAQAADPELVRLAGGADAVGKKASELILAGDILVGLHLADAALVEDPHSKPALEARLAGLKALQSRSRNMIEHAWLGNGIRLVQKTLSEIAAQAANPQ